MDQGTKELVVVLAVRTYFRSQEPGEERLSLITVTLVPMMFVE
jgi:hypothetical protein